MIERMGHFPNITKPIGSFMIMTNIDQRRLSAKVTVS